jgi:hypothetical protein
MGKVLVKATIENLEDLFSVQAGALPAERVRRIEVDELPVPIGQVPLELLDWIVTRRVNDWSVTPSTAASKCSTSSRSARQSTPRR